MIRNGEVQSHDVIYFQDFITPGVDGIFMALDLYGIAPKIYARCWAGTVDEYDFTYTMRHWMRFYELGLDSRLSGIFVGSTIHKLQLQQAGFRAPIHVLSLPVHRKKVTEILADAVVPKINRVIYTSRFDKEKNPLFMLQVAKKFLERNPGWEWMITTSARQVRSNVPFIAQELIDYAAENHRFIIESDIDKQTYYRLLRESKVQFNSALQDYVSFTLIESTIFGCDVVYPDFRSFADCVPKDRRYEPFVVTDAVNLLEKAAAQQRTYDHVSEISDLGLRLEGLVMSQNITSELNVWLETDFCKTLLNINK
jgi:glycosyltransferase involved in cell wall biosynthesis